MVEERTISYFPESNLLVKGYYDELPASIPPSLDAAIIGERKGEVTWDENGEKRLTEYETRLTNPHMRQLAATVARNARKIKRGQLFAADIEANRDNIDHLTLVRLYNQLMGDQIKYFHLQEMFNTIKMDKLQLRMAFKDNPAEAQVVGARERYDITKVIYDEIRFDLQKTVFAWDIPIEEPLRAMINPSEPLRQSTEWSMAYTREKAALAAIQRLGNHYTKNATGEARFTATTMPDDTKAKRISNPSTLTAGNVHSDNRTLDEINELRNQFMQEYDIMLTHWAMSPKTVAALAANTFTRNNTIFNVEAYRTGGATRAFPGLAEATAVVSVFVPDNVIYAVSKPNNCLVLGEGPKITKAFADNFRFTDQTATLDFYQHKCCHEDLSKITRKFGVIVDLQTT